MQGQVCKVLREFRKQSVYWSLRNNNIIPVCNIRDKEIKLPRSPFATGWQALIITSVLLLDMNALESGERASKTNVALMVRSDTGKDTAKGETGTLRSDE